MRPLSPVLPLLPLVLGLSACRGVGQVESLVGTWTGDLSCSAMVPEDPDEEDPEMVELDYTTSVILDLQDKEKMTYTGTIDAISTYTWKGYAVVQEASYNAEVQQSRPNGDQPVTIEKATCTDLVVTVDGDEVELDTGVDDPCDQASISAPTGDMRWDGANTFRIRRVVGDEKQNCTGTLHR